MTSLSNMRSSLLALTVVLATLGLSGCAGMGAGGQTGAQGAVLLTDEESDLFNAAMSSIAEEDYKEGVALLTDLTARTRKSPVPFINLAIAYKKQGDFSSAEKNLRSALEIEPQNPVASNELGLLLRRLGRFEEARAVYEEIIKTYPNFALANKNLGVLCDIYIRDYSCALKAYQAYSASVPDDEKVQLWITDLEWRVKQ